METILAQFVTWNNVINDYAVNVQNLLAPALGAMVAEVAITRNVDTVHLDLVTPFNMERAAPQHHILVEWLKNQELREADMALAQARLGLMDFLDSQADALASAGRAASAAAGRPIVLYVPCVERYDTPGAATLALLTEVPTAGYATSPGRLDRTSGTSGDRTSADRSTRPTRTSSPAPPAPPLARRSLGEGVQQPGSDVLSSGPGRPPGTADSASSNATDSSDSLPHTLTAHLQNFNGCVAALQQHLGPNYGVFFNVTPAACPVKGRCAHIRLMRHSHPARLASATNSGLPADPKPPPQSLKARLAAAASRRNRTSAEPTGLAAAAAAAAIAAASPQPPIPSRAASRAPSRATSQTGAGGRDNPPPPPGSAASIFGEEVVPVTLVDIVYSGITDAILRAERSVAVVGNELARLFDKYEPPLSLVEEPKHCRKLKTLPVAKEYVEANRKIQQLNAVLFKLAKAVAKTAWIYSTPLSMPDGTLGDVAQMVCEALRRVADTAWSMCHRHLDSVHLVTLLTHYEPFTITPRLINDDTRFRFELEVVADQSLLLTKTFPDFLPSQVRAVWDSLLALAAVVQESRTSLAPLRVQYRRLHEEVREFYTLAPEAAKQRRLGIGEAAAVARVINDNLAVIYEAEQVFDTYSRNVQRIVDAYTRAQREIKADLQMKLAELNTKLPRSIVKPTFSPEMLQMMRASVNPTELAATMTLALTASNMDASSLNLMQHSLAIGAMGSQQQGAGGHAALPQPPAPNPSQLPGGVPGHNPAAAGGGAVVALGSIGVLQQQQQVQMQLQAQQAAAAAAYGMYGMNGMAPAGAPAVLQGSVSQRAPPPAPGAPELAGHGTQADYAAQLAMAQAYGYAYNNPYAAAYGTYGSSTLGNITKSSNNLLAGMQGTASGVAPQAAPGPGAAAAADGGAGVAQGGPLAGTYQSAGYDAQTIAMLAQMGYGGFSVGQQQPQQQQQQPQAQG